MRNLALITYFYVFIFGCAGSLLLPGFFSSWGEQRLLSGCGAWISHCSGVSCCWAWALGCMDSVVVAHRLSCSAACGILLDQGSNLCLLHWQADSLPLSHQGSPTYFLKYSIMYSNFRCESTRFECKCFLFNFMISSQSIVFQGFLSQLLSSLPPSVWLIQLDLFITVFIPSF